MQWGAVQYKCSAVLNITVDQYNGVHAVDIIACGVGVIVPTHHQH